MSKRSPGRPAVPQKRAPPGATAGPRRRARWTRTFARISEDKRRRVLDCAKRAFARHGYAGTNVNLVARDAGISVGSLYQYFKTKENLFLTLIEESHGTLTSVIDGIFAKTPFFFSRIEELLTAAVEWSKKDPDLLNLYIAYATEELAPLAAKLAGRIESVAAERYREMVADARRRGAVSFMVRSRVVKEMVGYLPRQGDIQKCPQLIP